MIVYISFTSYLIIFNVICTWWTFIMENTNIYLIIFDWSSLITANITFSFLLDTYSLLMMLLVINVAFFVFIYSFDYMFFDDAQPRFMASLYFHI
jgi:NADH:ubiquinone oxidoreductase subunit 5 (subunit L)/multisubunit Na+/H+ antiporter MnhA subunit